jgi:3-methyladenine DNA glycosylase AlkD/uncharacterized protein YdhG (YjbR/CyaY superfamily)
MAAKPKCIDDYLAGVSPEQRAALEKLRKTIQAAFPDAEEGFSYGLPAFLLGGKPIAAFSTSAKHCSYFPMSGSVVAVLKDDLKNYDTSKGTIRFTPDKPLPASLIRKLVKARLAEIEAKPGKAKRAGTSDVNAVVAWLKRNADKKTLDGMARYAIPSNNAFGVPVNVMQKYAKKLGRNHDLAAALWETGWYEARMLACFLDEPERVTPAQMDRWCKDFDSWAIVDTVCFHLFDRVPHAYRKVPVWCRRKPGFQKRAGFALMACLALHDKDADDAVFADMLPLIEKAATDERNFVKKGVSWALRAIGRRPKLSALSLELAERLAGSSDAAARWVGKDVLRDLRRQS